MPVQEPVPSGEISSSTAPAFVAELSERVDRTRATIDSAAAAGDDDLVQAMLDDLEGLVDLAAAHDVALPDAVALLADRQQPDQVIDLTAGTSCAPA